MPNTGLITLYENRTLTAGKIYNIKEIIDRGVMSKEDKEIRLERLWLDEQRKIKQMELVVKILAGKLMEELEAEVITIQELAEFAAYNAIKYETKAEKAVNEFGTWFAIRRGGLKAARKLKKPNQYITDIYNHQGKTSNGGKAKSQNDEKSIAIRAIKDEWEKLKASYESEKMPRNTKRNFVEEKIEVEYKLLGLDKKSIDNELTYKK